MSKKTQQGKCSVSPPPLPHQTPTMNDNSNPEFAACVERRRAACGMTRAQLARLVRGRDRPEKEEVASIREEVLSAEVARRAAAMVARDTRRAQGERKEASPSSSSVLRQPGAAKAAAVASAHSSSPERSRGKGKGGQEERRCARCGQTADEAGVEKLRRCVVVLIVNSSVVCFSPLKTSPISFRSIPNSHPNYQPIPNPQLRELPDPVLLLQGVPEGRVARAQGGLQEGGGGGRGRWRWDGGGGEEEVTWRL